MLVVLFLTLIELICIENIWRNIVSIGLLGNKIGMTQIFDETGNIIPVTILKVGPCVITQVKTTLKDGYDAIQIGYGNVSSKSLTQPELGHLQKSNLQPLKYLKEFHINTEKDEFEVGQVLNVNSFTPGQLVNIRGKSIGKGFSGRRHECLWRFVPAGLFCLLWVVRRSGPGYLWRWGPAGQRYALSYRQRRRG